MAGVGTPFEITQDEQFLKNVHLKGHRPQKIFGSNFQDLVPQKEKIACFCPARCKKRALKRGQRFIGQASPMGKSMLSRSYSGDSALHLLDARIKFCAAIILMVAILSIQDPIIMAVFLIWTMMLMVLSKIRITTILRSVRPLVFIILFAVILHLSDSKGHILFHIGPIAISKRALYRGDDGDASS